MPEPLRYAIYCRVSTAEQADKGLSLGEQQRRLREYVEEQGGAVVGEYVDGGLSGRSDDRPAFQRLLRDLPRLDCVVITSVDRIMRSMSHLYQTEERLGAAGVRLKSLAGDYDTSTADGKMMHGLLGLLAERESNVPSERVRSTTRARARAGRYHGGPPPYGYRSGGEGQLVTDPGEAAVVERIFARFAEGASQQTIARELDRDGIPTRNGGRWHQGTIGKVLKNPVYRGEVRLRGQVYAGRHEAIISEEVWRRVSALLEAQVRTPSKGRGRPSAGDHLFTKGFLRCGRCGGSMYPVTKPNRRQSDYQVYACYRRKQDPEACDQPPIPRDRVDTTVFDYFAREGLDVEATRARLVETAERRAIETRTLAESAEREADRARDRLRRVRRDYQDGHVDADDWCEQRAELEPELLAAEAKATRLREQADTIAAEALPDLEEQTYRAIASARAAMTSSVRDAMTVEAARAALLTLFECFELNVACAGWAADAGLGTGVEADAALGTGISVDPNGMRVDWEYWLTPMPRREFIVHWRERWPVLKRVALPLGEKYADGLTT